MAVRKKSETIHLRVKPITKILLEGLANFNGTTSTRILEDLIADAAQNAVFKTYDDKIDVNLLLDGKLNLKTSLTLAYYPDEPILTKLRAFYIAYDTLNFKDVIILSTIIHSPEFFSGKTKIFSASDKIIYQKYLHEFPEVDLDKISKKMPSLEAFANFTEKNVNFRSNYSDFLKMIGEEQ